MGLVSRCTGARKWPTLVSTMPITVQVGVCSIGIRATTRNGGHCDIRSVPALMVSISIFTAVTTNDVVLVRFTMLLRLSSTPATADTTSLLSFTCSDLGGESHELFLFLISCVQQMIFQQPVLQQLLLRQLYPVLFRSPRLSCCCPSVGPTLLGGMG